MTIAHDDGLPDDRVRCGTCTHFRRAGTYCAAFKMLTWADLPVRCVRYEPTAADPDRRTGRQRWPTLNRAIEDARALDHAHREKALTP